MSCKLKGMVCFILQNVFQLQIILSSLVPCRHEGFDVIQLWAVIISLPVSLVRLLCEVGLPSLCSLSSSFM